MKALNKILVPIDLSENSVHTLQQAIDIANRCDAQIILLHAYSRPLLKLSGKKFFERNIIQSLEREMLHWKEHKVKSGVNTLMKGISDRHDIKFTIIREKGLLIEKIMEVIKNYGVDLVIAGMDNSNEGKNIWNSKVAKLTKMIKIPLLVLPQRSEMTKPVKIAFAYDLKDISDLEELNIVKIFSSVYNSEIHVFTVKSNDSLSKEELRNLDLLKEFFDGYSPIVHLIKDTDVEQGILHYLHKHQISLVTIIHRARNAVKGMFHKSISKRMVLDSDVPVLTLEEH